ncbi:hypothetical protein AB0N05_12235 [Nocardia sp. NPDC051030]|uniref:hypothetical protein n=1 Tax=Nocardia sp. NPDC051030 TaxID=3155162 RepID=UPI0034303020
MAILSAAMAASLGGAPGIAGAATHSADSDRAAVARAYIDALVSHDASAVRFAPDATRVEAGLQTGYSGPQLSRDLEHGVQYQVIQGIRDIQMTETGDVVTARYLLDSGVAGIRLMTVDITETFDIPDGTIHTIVATIAPV